MLPSPRSGESGPRENRAGAGGAVSRARLRHKHEPPSLWELSFRCVVHNIHHVSDLSSYPEDVVLGLFKGILAAGKLSEPVLQKFLATGHIEVHLLVEKLNIRPLPPLINERCKPYDRSGLR
eukprot:jgi/Chlat1/2217/Chrsp17S02552